MNSHALGIRAMLVALAASTMGACGDGADASRATGMRFLVQPATVVAGQTFSVSVEIVDASDVRVTSEERVAIGLEDGTPLTGTKTAVTSGGVATFGDLSITKAGSSVRLIASSISLATISNVFAITTGVPTVQSSSIGPSTQPVAIGAPRNLTFTFADAFGNPVASLPISLTSNLTGVTLTPDAGTTTSVGTFSSVINATTPGSVVLTAAVGGAQIAFAPLIVQPQCTPSPMAFPGSVTGTHPTLTCTIEGLPTLLYRFTTTAAGAASFSLTSGFPSDLSVTSDPPTTGVVVRGGTTQTAEWLLPAGTYQVRVGAVTGGGDFNLTSTSVPGNQGPVIRNIVVSGTYPQTLAAGDFLFPEIFGDNSFWDVFRLRSTGACTITARATGTPGPDLVLVVTDSAGAPVGADDDSAGGTDPQVTMNPCHISDGPLLAMVNHYPETPGGPYTLTVAFSGNQPAIPALQSWQDLRSRLRHGKRDWPVDGTR